ncbi:hypothetical protein HELRODRAFT_77058 [Helobdella robusta]|uniref:DNA-directed RNA polymerases I and III subunit RPAC1 n=1 Tax=Helobdella robusta TaxID=6412 RepID=T1G2S8_HELRO|nr:hypothetical protein HELRODRAFT_77058 [Helobdella robusta]ESO06950.1 hypothetical protein HELRODRAFT_77058 [Helobdella robusta]
MSVIEDLRGKVNLGEKEVTNVNSSDFPGEYSGFDDGWSQSKFEKAFRIDVVKIDDRDMEFDMVGIDPALANSFRRILLEEVPTMAIDRIEIRNNTSIVSDEILAHRLGLVPIKADARLFEYRPKDSTEMTATDSIGFKLQVKCQKNLKASKGTLDKNELYNHFKVTTKDLIWFPVGDQTYTDENEIPKPADDDILIAKLKPGQEIDIVCYCFKGIGKDHAKFSPVATAFYRNLPEIKLLRKVTGRDAELLKSSFSEGVIELVPDENGVMEARVVDSRKDMLSRNAFRYEELKGAFQINLIIKHFIFSVESTGVMPPEVLVSEAIKVLMKKCKHFLKEIDDI